MSRSEGATIDEFGCRVEPYPELTFVSHSHQDIDLCDAFVAALRERSVDVWYDRSDLQAGQFLSAEIQRELEARTVYISSHSRSSAQTSAQSGS